MATYSLSFRLSMKSPTSEWSAASGFKSAWLNDTETLKSQDQQFSYISNGSKISVLFCYLSMALFDLNSFLSLYRLFWRPDTFQQEYLLGFNTWFYRTNDKDFTNWQIKRKSSNTFGINAGDRLPQYILIPFVKRKNNHVLRVQFFCFLTLLSIQ